jgi:cation channel sperm-associated protein 4
MPDMDLKNDENIDSYNKVRFLFFNNSMKNNLSRLRQKNLKFSDIVDVDYIYYDDYVKNKLATRLEESNYFRYTMCLVVILNCILIGLQTDEGLVQKNPALFDFLDLATLSIYIMEIVVKWYIDFWGFWLSGWNIFDFALVAVGILGRYASVLGSNSRILKILRVLRSLRSFKSITFMSGIQAIIATLINSVPEMINIVILLLIFMFIFAVLGVTLFAPYDDKHFGNLASTMYTLFILLTQDGWADIYDYLYDAGQSLFASIYFSLFIIIGPFIFINMIVAVVVTNFEKFYMEKKKQDKLKTRKLVTDKSTSKGTYQRNVLPFPDISNSVFREQIPYEIPDLSKISLEKLHKYFLILMLIEENLKEFLEIKTELVEIFKVVQDAQDIEESESSEDETVDIDDDDNRDVLSRWIKSKHNV